MESTVMDAGASNYADLRDYLPSVDFSSAPGCSTNNGELSEDPSELLSRDWVSPGKPEDQALPSTSPNLLPNASPAIAPNTPNAPSVEEAASSFTQVVSASLASPPLTSTTTSSITAAPVVEEPMVVKAGRGRGRKRSRGAGGESGSRGPPRKRGPKPVRYCSQIAPETNGIKIRIKKFNSNTATEVTNDSVATGSANTSRRPPREPRKKRRRARNRRAATESDDEAADEALLEMLEDAERASAWGRYELPKPSLSFSVEDTTHGGEQQSDWGCRLPVHVLTRVFEYVVVEEGPLPFLVRASRVCRLWRNVAIEPSLWSAIDLSAPWVRHAHRNDHTLRWLCENRLSCARNLVLSWWKVSNVNAMLEAIMTNCGAELQGLSLGGWGGLRGEHLEQLAQRCPKLCRIDLSSINGEVVANSKTAVSPGPLCAFTQNMGSRLTQLTLANNTVAGLTQILNAVADTCCELQVLDLSNIRTAAISSALIPLERLQEGCTKLRVFRIANSHVALAVTSLQEQAESPGFPQLEELSLAVDKQGGQPFVSDSAIERILKTSHQLRLLDVRGCSRISDSSLVRVPAWDLEHLFLSGCDITRASGDGLELLSRKWSHSLVEVDLAWSTATEALDLAVSALAEKGAESPLRVLSLLGSSVSFGPVKEVLLRCPQLYSLNLSSCRGLPRGIKRLYVGDDLAELRRNVAAGRFDEQPEADQEQSESPLSSASPSLEHQ